MTLPERAGQDFWEAFACLSGGWPRRSLLSYVDLEERILRRHLFRKNRQVVNNALVRAKESAAYAVVQETGGLELSALNPQVMGLFAKTEI